MFKIAIGHSDDVDSIDAISEVLNQCKRELGSDKPKAGILFSAIDYDHDKILKFISKKYPKLKLIGCTTDGEISSILGFKDDSITLLLLSSDSIEFGVGLGKNLSKDMNKACRNAVVQAKKGLKRKDLKFAITTPESLTVSGARILNYLTKELGK